MDKLIFHCDLNNFFASVNLLSYPEYAEKPVAVAGDIDARHGIILAKNQIAKGFGVSTGEPIFQSKQKCPDIIILKPQYDDYAKYSKIVFNIYTKYTDLVEPFGIDECFLDLTNSEKILGDPITVANKIKEDVKATTGLTISVGISFTKALAKLGSDMKKPDAITTLFKSEYFEKIKDFPVNTLIGIGNKTYEKLKHLNIRTISDLYHANDLLMKANFGVIGKELTDMARGESSSVVRHFEDKQIPKSISNGITTPEDMPTLKSCYPIIYGLSEYLAVRLREQNVHGRLISVSLRKQDLSFIQKQNANALPIYSTSDIAENVIALISSFYNFSMPIRSISIAVGKLESNQYNQLTLFENKQEIFEEGLDKVRKKYGFSSITRGIVKSKIASELLHNQGSDFKPFGH